MPIFEYTCKQCKKEFETLVFSSRDPAPQCPACGSQEVAKKVSAASLTRSGGCTPSTSGRKFG